MIFLPLYLPYSTFLQRPRTGVVALLAWIAAQGVWLSQAYELEFWGRSTFVPGLWGASLLFFVVNVGILGTVVRDVGRME